MFYIFLMIFVLCAEETLAQQARVNNKQTTEKAVSPTQAPKNESLDDDDYDIDALLNSSTNTTKADEGVEQNKTATNNESQKSVAVTPNTVTNNVDGAAMTQTAAPANTAATADTTQANDTIKTLQDLIDEGEDPVVLNYCLEMVRSLLQDPVADGSPEELNKANTTLAPLVLLPSRLQEADTVEKISELSGLNEKGRSLILANQKTVNLLQSANSLQILVDLPIKDFLRQRLKERFDLERQISEAKTLQDVSKITGLPKATVDAMLAVQAYNDNFLKVDSLEKLKKLPKVNAGIIKDIETAEQISSKIHNAVAIEDLKQIPGINGAVIIAIEQMEGELKSIQEKVKTLTTQNEKLQEEINIYNNVTDRVQDFRLRFIELLIKIQTGLNVRQEKYDAEAESDTYKGSVLGNALNSEILGIVKTSAHQDWILALNRVHELLRLLITDDGWYNKTDIMRDKIEDIQMVLRYIQNSGSMKALNEAVGQLSTTFSAFINNEKIPPAPVVKVAPSTPKTTNSAPAKKDGDKKVDQSKKKQPDSKKSDAGNTKKQSGKSKKAPNGDKAKKKQSGDKATSKNPEEGLAAPNETSNNNGLNTSTETNTGSSAALSKNETPSKATKEEAKTKTAKKAKKKKKAKKQNKQ